ATRQASGAAHGGFLVRKLLARRFGRGVDPAAGFVGRQPGGGTTGLLDGQTNEALDLAQTGAVAEDNQVDLVTSDQIGEVGVRSRFFTLGSGGRLFGRVVRVGF